MLDTLTDARKQPTGSYYFSIFENDWTNGCTIVGFSALCLICGAGLELVTAMR